jgi:hypothetical protein
MGASNITNSAEPYPLPQPFKLGIVEKRCIITSSAGPYPLPQLYPRQLAPHHCGYYKLSRAVPSPATADRSVRPLGEYILIVARRLACTIIIAPSQARGKGSPAPAPACIIDAKHIAILGHHSLPRVLLLSKAPLNAAVCLPLTIRCE